MKFMNKIFYIFLTVSEGPEGFAVVERLPADGVEQVDVAVVVCHVLQGDL